jgi:hypothetical protein
MLNAGEELVAEMDTCSPSADMGSLFGVTLSRALFPDNRNYHRTHVLNLEASGFL